MKTYVKDPQVYAPDDMKVMQEVFERLTRQLAITSDGDRQELAARIIRAATVEVPDAETLIRQVQWP